MKKASKKSLLEGQEPHSGRQQTRDSLLDAAEELFLEHGIDGASVRAITTRADANLAAVSYHFGNKEGLVRAVFDRGLRPVNEERIRRLDALEAEAAPDSPDAEAVLRSFLEPVVHFGQESSAERARFQRLMGRSFAEPGEKMRQRLMEQFQEVGERFLRALSRCFPELASSVILWRFHLMVGSMVQVALHGELILEHSGGACDPSEGGEVVDRLVEFVLAGFSAPVASPPEEDPRASLEDESDGDSSIFPWEEGF